MNILGTLFRLLCALLVLLSLAVYLDGSLQATLTDYLAAFTPAHLQALASLEGWPAIAAGALLLLTLCCGIRLGWNLFYSLATLAFFAGLALTVLGPECALPSPARGLGWEPMLRELARTYPVPTLMVPAFCIVGCLCSTAPFRIAWTSLLSCLLCYGCAELLAYGVQHWQAMPEPFMPQALDMIKRFPWILLALPAVFFLQYCLFMALFETFIPRKKAAGKKAKAADKKDEGKEAEATPAESAAKEKNPAKTAATVPLAAKPLGKRPVVLRKKPLSAASAEVKEEKQPEPKAEESAPAKNAPAAEETKAEEAPATAEETKENAAPAGKEAPAAASEEKAPAEEKAEEKMAEEAAPKAEEAPEAAKEEKPAAPAAE